MRGRVGGRLAVVGVVAACCVAGALPAVAADPTPTPSPTAAEPSAAAKQGKQGKAGGEASDTHAAEQLYEASQALQAAQADLRTARDELQSAEAQERAARRADEKARIDLRAAQLAEDRAVRELADVRARIAAHQEDLGKLARNAYQSNGPLGEWAVVFDSDTPQQLADRMTWLNSIASAGNSIVGDLEDDRADLESKQARLTAVRELKARAKARAAAALALMEQKTMAAQQAQDAYGLVVKARQAAVDAALKAKQEDERRYHVMLFQSGALEARIVDLSAKLADSEHPPHGTGDFVRPGTGVVTSPYGPRYHPILHYVKVHTGIDFASGDGLVYAADRGTVIITEFNVAYGNMTVIDHGTVGGLHMATLYAHQAAFAVKPGDRVHKGQPIGVIGDTGYATGPHLHFEVRIDGKPLDPAPFLKGAPLPRLARKGALTPDSLLDSLTAAG